MTGSAASAWVLAAVLSGAVPGTLIDRVVAVVDKQVLTLSELLVEARVALVLREGEQAGSADLDEAAMRAFLDYTVNQMLVSMQARRLGGVEVASAEIEREVRRFAQRFRSPDAYRAFLRRFDIAEDTLRNLLERNLRNERYITARMRLSADGSGDWDPSTSRYQQALRRWLEDLRDTADLRIVNPTGELELQERRPPGPAVLDRGVDDRP